MNCRTGLSMLMLGLLFTSSALGQKAEKYALLIGVTKYEHARVNSTQLKFPEEDAKAVSKLLTDAGYTVELLLGQQATKARVNENLTKARSQGTAGGVVIIGLFGHGVQYGDDAYFEPYDTGIRVVTDADGKELRDKSGGLLLEPAPASMISMRSILDTLTVCGAGSKILLADCCREDPSAARGRAFGSNLQREGLPPGMVAFFACSNGERAFEHDDWGHGAFTRAFIDVCTTGNRVTAGRLSDDLHDRVSEMVRARTNGQYTQTVNFFTNSRGSIDLQLSPPEVPPEFTNSVGMILRRIPAGTFQMGSPDSDTEAGEVERPRHSVTISRSFYMGQTEVTQGQWKSVMGTEPWKSEDYVREGTDYPATYVSWEDAVEYCRRLSERDGRTYRLPTEAEWEYACRGGRTTRYSFGDSPDELGQYAWFDGNAWDIDEKYAHRVGQKRANPYGLYDMHGNVWEWCSDWFDGEYYAQSSSRDPSGPSSPGSGRVSRGGSWNLNPRSFRSASRLGFSPEYRGNVLGFRLVSVGQ